MPIIYGPTSNISFRRRSAHQNRLLVVLLIFFCLINPVIKRSAPAKTAMSAALNIPVLNEPIPRLTKSTTCPLLIIRSVKFPIPPPVTNTIPISWRRVTFCPLNTRIGIRINSNPVKRTKMTKRTSGESSAPRLRKAPGFSIYSNLMRSLKNEVEPDDDKTFLATDLVSWSQPTHDNKSDKIKPNFKALFTIFSFGSVCGCLIFIGSTF
jgi:hypothetical protein